MKFRFVGVFKLILQHFFLSKVKVRNALILKISIIKPSSPKWIYCEEKNPVAIVQKIRWKVTNEAFL